MGGNLGSMDETFRRALELLPSHGIEVAAVSSLYESAPMGFEAGQPFLNAAAEISVTCTAHECLAILQQLEDTLGRVRHTHWGPRTIDLDLGLFGDEVHHTAELIVPHPACSYRRFAIDPLVEIAPDFVHPVMGKELRSIQKSLLARPLPIVISGFNQKEQQQIQQLILTEFPEVDLRPQNQSEAAIFLQAGGNPRTTPPDCRMISFDDVPGDTIEACKAILSAATLAPHIRHNRFFPNISSK
ncbi:Bifunctional folate synthesis protein [Calycomorphotria hydatis]|uniref:2-amino-4-hydroxy-6-hydroxymethyldihydropteridine pyrophosphokinase n=2 Tax=Calycomorphotria hydatis TaxID=2528027 RepID=A0A517T479_9PLAN|nr:Bifunctional folate synthesis protein [Calycomorphotria hydatis]